jgi:hypothetical protein
MSTKTQIIEEQTTDTSVEVQSLQEIVNVVRRDSQIDAKAYLKETEVPHGGE